MYFIRKDASQGTWIMRKGDFEDYKIALMRWTDGLNKEVEKAVKDDAERICAALNFVDGIDTSILIMR